MDIDVSKHFDLYSDSEMHFVDCLTGWSQYEYIPYVGTYVRMYSGKQNLLFNVTNRIRQISSAFLQRDLFEPLWLFGYICDLHAGGHRFEPPPVPLLSFSLSPTKHPSENSQHPPESFLYSEEIRLKHQREREIRGVNIFPMLETHWRTFCLLSLLEQNIPLSSMAKNHWRRRSEMLIKLKYLFEIDSIKLRNG